MWWCDPNKKKETGGRGPITDYLLGRQQYNATLSATPILSPMDHPYATRIRQNITLKCSSKLVDNVVPPHHYPPFPPPHIQLHPDDLNNKVFLAVARSFLSVVRHTILSFIKSPFHPFHRTTAP